MEIIFKGLRRTVNKNFKGEMMNTEREKIIIGNCSGFYGDRLSAAKDMVEGGPIDVIDR